MSRLDDLHAQLEAVKARGREMEKQYAAILARLNETDDSVVSDLSKLKMNMTSYVPLHQAHELAVRQNELYEAMQIVEQCGASPELTEAVNRLGERLRHIQADLTSAVTEAAFWAK